MENAYAQALWKMIEKGTPQADAVRVLHKYLKANGREALLPRIAKAFERIARKHNEHDAIVLSVADKSHEQAALSAACAIEPAASQAHIVIDPSLIGGWRLDARETLVDASYKKHLLQIYRSTTNA